MLAIPSALQTKFEEHLRNKTIQNSLHGVYKKWLQYYRVIAFSFHVNAPSQKIPPEDFTRNQQRLPGKWEDPDFEGQAHLAN